MPHAPRIPKEQSSFTGRGGMAVEDSLRADRHDPATVSRTEPPRAAEASLENPGWFGDLRQTLTNHWMVEQR